MIPKGKWISSFVMLAGLCESEYRSAQLEGEGDVASMQNRPNEFGRCHCDLCGLRALTDTFRRAQARDEVPLMIIAHGGVLNDFPMRVEKQLNLHGL